VTIDHLLRIALDQSPASVIITDARGAIQYVNRGFTTVTGYLASEVIGQNPRLLQSGTTPPETYHALWSTVRSGRIWRGELLNRKKSGEFFWNAVTIAPVRDASGTITHFVGTQEDVTARKLAQEALAESEQRFRRLIEATFDGIDVTQDGIVLEANQGLADIFGYTVDEVVGRPVEDFVAPESREEVRRRVREGTPGTYELVGLRKDGSRIHLEAAGKSHTIRGRPGRVTAVRDVTEKRRLEEQFRQAQKMEAVGRLAGGVAHDFNNLLTVITSYSEMVLDDLAPADPRREDLQQVQKAAVAATALTRQLLAFSRQQIIEPRLVSLEEAVSGTARILGRLIGEDIDLVTALAPEPSTVRIDPGQLEQVIMNLAVNARDAMPNGGRLTIGTAVVEEDEESGVSHWPVLVGRFALLSVSDTGVGMDRDTQAKIFEPFFTTKELGKGTGLGLATVYGIIKQSGGFIWVYSEPGAGTTFKIYLPLVDAPSDPIAREGPDPQTTGTESILLVEDAEAVRSAARRILEHRGYRVLEAANGEAALRLVADPDLAIDLLLTDLVMPGGSGRELAEQFSAARPEGKVLYMSGYTNDAAIHHGILKPGIEYLQKPFSPVTLARKVREVHDRR
jgi:two-component system cell cycle sensor histidine kinase/response regulator CckA